MDHLEYQTQKANEKKLRVSVNGILGAVVAQNILMFCLVIFLSLFVGIAGGITFSINKQGLEGITQLLKNLTSTGNVEGLLNNIFIYIFALFIPYAVYLLIRKRKITDIISFKLPKASELFIGISISLGFFVVGKYLSNFILLLLNAIGFPPNEPALDTPTGTVGMILFAIMISVLPPIFEEFAFRGVVLGEAKKFNPYFAVLLSSVAFSLMHGTIQQIPYAFTVGLAMGYFVIKYNSIWISVITHLIVNGVGTYFSFAEEKLSEKVLAALSFSTDAVFVLFAVIAFVIFLANGKFTLPKSENHLSFGNSLVNLLLSPLIYIFVVLSAILTFMSGYLNG